MNRFLAVDAAVVMAAAVALAGCNYVPQITPYRMEIQQGNFLTQEMAAQLKPGMTKDQVRFVLGTPLLIDPFHANRWDYVFSRMRENSRELEQRRITVYFDNGGTLQRVEGDVVAAAAAKPSANSAKPLAEAK
jgi:outer membrane protein assembly factor BamE